MLFEYKGHIHIHTRFSDGSRLHADICREAIAAGLDFLIITDHNVWVDGLEGYYGDDRDGRVLLLVGEEVHDVRRQPPGNHCLVFGAGQEMAQHASDPQAMIDAVNATGGFCFLAHPIEIGSSLLRGGELDPLGWQDWEVTGYTGLEIWNYMSEFKSHLTGKLAAIRSSYQPQRYIRGPFGDTLKQWDSLLSQGRQVACIGGGDVHGSTYHLGPLERTVFPYRSVFQSLNTHLLTPKPLTGELNQDRDLVLSALRQGHGWVGYDAAGETAGFRFSGQGFRREGIMGDVIALSRGGLTLQVTSPELGHIRLLCNGTVVAETAGRTNLLFQTSEPGAYRAEVFTRFAGDKRGWIYSNPIYVRRRAQS
jgi:hypothetical protein